jgi:hypothetical protein
MRDTLMFLLLIGLKIGILPFLFKAQQKFVLLVGFLLSVFVVSVFVLLAKNTGANEYMAFAGLVLLECAGYWLYMRCGWKKALLTGIAANLIFILCAILAVKLSS